MWGKVLAQKLVFERTAFGPFSGMRGLIWSTCRKEKPRPHGRQSLLASPPEHFTIHHYRQWLQSGACALKKGKSLKDIWPALHMKRYHIHALFWQHSPVEHAWSPAMPAPVKKCQSCGVCFLLCYVSLSLFFMVAEQLQSLTANFRCLANFFLWKPTFARREWRAWWCILRVVKRWRKEDAMVRLLTKTRHVCLNSTLQQSAKLVWHQNCVESSCFEEPRFNQRFEVPHRATSAQFPAETLPERAVAIMASRPMCFVSSSISTSYSRSLDKTFECFACWPTVTGGQTFFLPVYILQGWPDS